MQQKQLHHVVVSLPAGTGQRNVVVATARDVHFCSVLQEESGDTRVSSKGSKHERTEAFLRPVLNVGSSLEEQLDDLFVTFPAGKGQWTILVTVGFDVDLRPVIKEELGHFLVAGQCREHESSAAIFGAVFHVGLTFEKQLYDFDVAEGAGPCEGAVVRCLRGSIYVGVPVKE